MGPKSDVTTSVEKKKVLAAAAQAVETYIFKGMQEILCSAQAETDRKSRRIVRETRF